MEAAKVDVRYVQVRCCAKRAPCPTCGKRGRRKQVLPPRLVRTIAYKQVVYLEITAAEYYARCGCCKTFRSHPEGVGPVHLLHCVSRSENVNRRKSSLFGKLRRLHWSRKGHSHQETVAWTPPNKPERGRRKSF